MKKLEKSLLVIAGITLFSILTYKFIKEDLKFEDVGFEIEEEDIPWT